MNTESVKIDCPSCQQPIEVETPHSSSKEKIVIALLSGILIVLIIIAWPKSKLEEKPSLPKWEYTTIDGNIHGGLVDFRVTPFQLKESNFSTTKNEYGRDQFSISLYIMLSEMGKFGWRFLQTRPLDYGETEFLFERQEK